MDNVQKCDSYIAHSFIHENIKKSIYFNCTGVGNGTPDDCQPQRLQPTL
jgi:hypothetical protein